MNINLTINPDEVTIIIKDFIKTYVENSGINGVVIGLSGGVDSAVVAKLCKDVFGKKNTRCVFLPNETTPEQDFKHLDLLIKKLDLFCEKKEITNLINETDKHCILKPDKFALANIKTRIRMAILFEYANMTNSLVCGTSNKSELLVGYFTKYGDGGVDIQPIGDLYKTQVWELARFLKIPKEIISKPPTAGLWKGQTDEKDLKISYKHLDLILAGLEQKMNFDDIAKIAGVKTSDVQRIHNMRVKSQHKRKTPLIPKIGIRTIGIDWRSSVQNK